MPAPAASELTSELTSALAGERRRDAVFHAAVRSEEEAARKRLAGSRGRAAPSVYFLPRQSPLMIAATYGAIAVAGVAAGMGIEGWIRRKVEGG